MRVLVYMGDYHIVKNSGVGKAILHQRKMLDQIGVEVFDKWSEQVDVIHINTILPASVLAALKARRLGVWVVYYGHSTEEDFRNSFIGSNFFAPLFKKWIKFCYCLGDVILTPTEYSKNILKSYGIRKPIYSISNGVDTEFFKPSPTRRKIFRDKYQLSNLDKVVISVGHLIERKGILDFLKLARETPTIQFIWFGYTDQKLITKNIKKAIASAPSNVLFAGYVNQNELRDAYCGSDLFAFFSHEETEGIVVLEALACEIPVLVRDISVYKDWLIDNENVYKGNSFKEFKEISYNILNRKISDLTSNGLLVASERSMSNMGKKLKNIYSAKEYI